LADATTLEIHKALADDTRFRLYRYLGLSGRAVSVRELSRRLSLHPNTVRPHLRRLEEAGLVTREIRKGSGTKAVGRPETLFAAVEVATGEGRDYRLLAEMLAGLFRDRRDIQRAAGLSREWGQYLIARKGAKPGVRLPAGRNLALLQEAMAEAGFEPRFRRQGGKAVEVTLRMCPFRDLLDEHRELVCALHRGLVEGMLGALKPPLSLKEFKPLAERSVCRLQVSG
jgi:predicted ArsR family transcriptional regulator